MLSEESTRYLAYGAKLFPFSSDFESDLFACVVTIRCELYGLPVVST